MPQKLTKTLANLLARRP